MEQCTYIIIVVIWIISVFGSYIVFANSKTRNSESYGSCTNILSFNISAINANCNLTGSIRNIQSHSNGLIITISDISRNYNKTFTIRNIRNIRLINMEQSTCITIIIIRVINVLNSHIILTNSKIRYDNFNCRVIHTRECGSIDLSAINLNNNSTASIRDRNSNSNGFIIKISDIYSTYIYIGSCRINMEQCRSIGIIIVSITSVLNSNIILTNSKTRNSESNSIRTIFSNVLGQFHISAINLNGNITSSIIYIDCYSNGLII